MCHTLQITGGRTRFRTDGPVGQTVAHSTALKRICIVPVYRRVFIIQSDGPDHRQPANAAGPHFCLAGTMQFRVRGSIVAQHSASALLAGLAPSTEKTLPAGTYGSNPMDCVTSPSPAAGMALHHDDLVTCALP